MYYRLSHNWHSCYHARCVEQCTWERSTFSKCCLRALLRKNSNADPLVAWLVKLISFLWNLKVHFTTAWHRPLSWIRLILLYSSLWRAWVARSVWCLAIDWTTGVRSSAEARDFSSSLCAQTSSEASPASCPMVTGGKARPGRDADHSQHPVPWSKMSRSYTTYFPYRLHGRSGTALLWHLLRSIPGTPQVVSSLQVFWPKHVSSSHLSCHYWRTVVPANVSFFFQTM
jgi:hypothetical protein